MRGSHFGRRPARLQTPSLTVLRRQVRPLDLPRVPQPRFPCGGPAVQPQGWRTWGDGASGRGGAGPAGGAASRVTEATVPTVLALDVFDTLNFTGAWLPRFEDVREDVPRELVSSVFFPADFFTPPERRGEAPRGPRAALGGGGGSCHCGGRPGGSPPQSTSRGCTSRPSLQMVGGLAGGVCWSQTRRQRRVPPTWSLARHVTDEHALGASAGLLTTQ